MDWIYNDGGREAAGFKGDAGDCVCRAIAIATNLPYRDVYDRINLLAKKEKIGKRKTSKSNARNGVYTRTYTKLLEELGWQKVSTCHIGKGVSCHLTADELPKGTLIVRIAKHLVCVKDGVINDTYNSSLKQYYDEYGDLQTNDRRAVYGYWYKENAI